MFGGRKAAMRQVIAEHTQEERLQHAKSNEAFVPGAAGQTGLCQALPAMEPVDLSKQAIAPPVVLSGSEMIYRRRKRCVDDESLVTVEAILLPDRSAFIPSYEHTRSLPDGGCCIILCSDNPT